MATVCDTEGCVGKAFRYAIQAKKGFVDHDQADTSFAYGDYCRRCLDTMRDAVLAIAAGRCIAIGEVGTTGTTPPSAPETYSPAFETWWAKLPRGNTTPKGLAWLAWFKSRLPLRPEDEHHLEPRITDDGPLFPGGIRSPGTGSRITDEHHVPPADRWKAISDLREAWRKSDGTISNTAGRQLLTHEVPWLLAELRQAWAQLAARSEGS